MASKRIKVVYTNGQKLKELLRITGYKLSPSGPKPRDGGEP